VLRASGERQGPGSGLPYPHFWGYLGGLPPLHPHLWGMASAGDQGLVYGPSPTADRDKEQVSPLTPTLSHDGERAQQ
jgi:hypothetical protein